MQHSSAQAIMAGAEPVRPDWQNLTVAVFDTETDGLLNQLTRMHLLIVRKIVNGVVQGVRVFRHNKREDTIRQGLEYLADADVIVGHNIIGFDLLAIEKVYPDFQFRPGTRFRDTEVLARMMFANQKEKDFQLIARGTKLSPGSMELEAWGKRMGLHKGDYKKNREDEAKALGIVDPDEVTRFVWGEWNQPMEDYAVQDVEVGLGLWMKCVAEMEKTKWPERSIIEQHQAHDLMIRQQHFGFGFDADRALQLSDTLRNEFRELTEKAKDHFKPYWYPAKLHRLGSRKITNGKRKGEVVHNAPRPEFGEDDSRAVWGEVTVPLTENKNGRKITYKDGREGGSPYCRMELREFKPTSRQAIVNRLTTIYNWTPTEFTDKGSVKVSDDILRPLAEKWPICETLADIFFYQKMIGAVSGADPDAVLRHLQSGAAPAEGDDDGAEDDDIELEDESGDGDEGDEKPAAKKAPAKKKKSSAWLLNYDPRTGCIHHRCVVGGTVSRRATHSNPNLGQTKGVEGAKAGDNPNQTYTFQVYSKKTGGDWKLDEKTVRLGRIGNFGWESRECFTPPPGFEAQVGIDLSGIEMRALGARLKPFDGGEFLRLVTTPGQDVHKVNAMGFGISSASSWEDVAEGEKKKSKVVFYAMVYGSGDENLGSVVLPAGTPAAQLKQRGAEMKSAFFSANPAFARLLKWIEANSRRGYLDALDGGRLYVRNAHSALNLQLQSDGALLAQKWMLITNELLEEDGLEWGVDYGQMAYVHDEDQYAARTFDLAYHIGDRSIEAAAMAGEFYNYAAPVAAEARVGRNWAECH